MTSRWINIDDADSRIDYQGKWEAHDGSKFNGKGDWGNVWANTLHGINEEGSFTFTYDGSSGRVIGSINFINQGADGFDPEYECLLDGNKIEAPKPDLTLRNGYELCRWDQQTVQDGTHTVTVNVKSAGQYFFLDHFMYLPLPTSRHDDENLIVESWDTNIRYSIGDWENLTSWSRMCRKGGILSFRFYGTGILWSSLRPKEYPGGQTLVVYSLDGRPSTAVVLSGPGSRTQWNHVVFSVSNLTREFHTLNVQSLGTEKTTPLSIDTLKVSNGAFPEPVDTASPITVIPPATTTTGYFTVSSGLSRTRANDATITNSSASANGRHDANKDLIGPIVGGVLGGLTIVLLFVLGLVYIRKKVGAADDDDGARVITPYTALPVGGPYELADQVRSQASFSSRRTERTGRSASQRSPPVGVDMTPTTTSDSFLSLPHSRNNSSSRNAAVGRTNSLFAAGPAQEVPIISTKSESLNEASTTSSGRRGQRSRDAERYRPTPSSSEASSSSSRSRGDAVLNRHNSLFATQPLSALPTKESLAFQASGSRPSRNRNMPSLPPPMEDDGYLAPGFGESSTSSTRHPPPPLDIPKGKLGRVNTLFVPHTPQTTPPLLPEKIMTMSYQHGTMRSQGSSSERHTGNIESQRPAAHHQTTRSTEFNFEGLPQARSGARGVDVHGNSSLSGTGIRIPPSQSSLAPPDSPPPPISPLTPPPGISPLTPPPTISPLTPPPAIDAIPRAPPTPPPDIRR